MEEHPTQEFTIFLSRSMPHSSCTIWLIDLCEKIYYVIMKFFDDILCFSSIVVGLESDYYPITHIFARFATSMFVLKSPLPLLNCQNIVTIYL